jgi:5-methylcytosine-specific restriction endonuclease McrA
MVRRRRWQRGGPELAAWVRAVLWFDPCAYCGSSGRTADHIVALHRGGRGDADNLTGACPRCNAEKGELGLLEFLLRRAERATGSAGKLGDAASARRCS